MAASADVATHLGRRARPILDSLRRLADPEAGEPDRVDVLEQYFGAIELGDVERIGSGASLLVRGDGVRAGRPTLLVVGSHDTTDLRHGAIDLRPVHDEILPMGPGIGSRFAPTIAFAEGFLAARRAMPDDPVDASFVSVGPGDRAIDVLRALRLDRPDSVIVTNAVAWSPAHPTLTTGCRGRLEAELTLRGGPSLDDGVCAGAIRNPLTKLVEILGALRDERGRIALPGFYDRAAVPGDEYRDALTVDDHDPDAWAAFSPARLGSARVSSLERATAWPVVSILDIGAEGDAAGSAIPRSATARIAIHLVPDQRHAEVELGLRGWFAGLTPPDLRGSVRLHSSARPYRSPPDRRPLLAQVRAARRVHGRRPILVPAGGPAGAGEIADLLGAPVAFAGVCGPEHGFGSRHEVVPRALLNAAVAMASETCRQLRRGVRDDPPT